MALGNLMDYMEWRGDVSFSASPFNEVDNLILAMTTQLDFTGIISQDPGDKPVSFAAAMKAFDALPDERKYLGLLMPERFVNIPRRAARCPRFARIRLAGFVNVVDEGALMQFAALTFILPERSLYVAYRGTDDTIVGWKEDLRLSFKTPLPAHLRAAEYIRAVASSFEGRIRLGGHSKGGNLAMWAASHCEDSIQERIICVYNNDGPGFLPEVLKEPSYLAVADRIITFVPESSVVGGLLERGPVCRIIKSAEGGILQHDPLSWQLIGTRFINLEKRSRFGEHTEEALRSWLYSMNPEERESFTEMIFSIIDRTGAKTLTDLNGAKLKNFNIIMKALLTLDRDHRVKFNRLMRELLVGGKESGGKKHPPSEGASPSYSGDSSDGTDADEGAHGDKLRFIPREGELQLKFFIPADDREHREKAESRGKKRSDADIPIRDDPGGDIPEK